MSAITCPNCQAESRAPAGQDLAGRKLRCPRCKTVWRMAEAPRQANIRRRGALVPVARVIPEVDISAPLMPVHRVSRPPRRTHTIIDIAPTPTVAPPSPDTTGRATPRLDLAGIAACFLAGIMLTGAVMLRDPVVRFAPGLADLYALAGLEVNRRGLAFSDLTVSRDNSSGSPVLTVGGTVTNVTADEVAIPAIRLALKASDRRELYTWRVEPTTTRLAPGETFRFRSQLAETAVTIATNLEVRFTGRRQQLAEAR